MKTVRNFHLFHFLISQQFFEQHAEESINYADLRESTNYGDLRELTNYGGLREFINYAGLRRSTNYESSARVCQLLEPQLI